MDLREFVLDALSRNRQNTLGIVKDLTEGDLYWRPFAGTNPIGFLLWHVARSEDGLYLRWLSNQPQVWVSKGFAKAFRLGEMETGNSWTAEQVAAFRAPSKQAILDYMQAVRETSVAAIKTMDMRRLPEEYNPKDRPGRTIANLLQLSITHEAHHQGATEYLAGVRKAMRASA